MKSRLHTNTRVFQIIFSLCVLPPHTNSSSHSWARAVPNKWPFYTRNYHIFGHFFLFAYLCPFVLGCCKPILAWQRPPYHVFITGQVIILCNISYFSARGYTLTLTHIHLREAGCPKLTMGIFRCAFLKAQEQMMNCRSCLCSRGSLGNLPRQNTLPIFPLPQLPMLSRSLWVWHPSFLSSSPRSKPPGKVPSCSLKPGEAWDACPLPQPANFPQ